MLPDQFPNRPESYSSEDSPARAMNQIHSPPHELLLAEFFRRSFQPVESPVQKPLLTENFIILYFLS